MHKIYKVFLVFIIVIFPFSSNSHVEHYKDLNSIEFDIYRNNKFIGTHIFTFKELTDELHVKSLIKFQIKKLGVVLYKYYAEGTEIYKDNKLIKFNSKTKQNKKEKFVNLLLNEEKNKFIIKGSSYSGETDTDNIVGNWWNHKLLQAESQISPISGSIKEQVVTFIAKEKIELYGKSYETEHFKLKSKNQSLPDDKKLNFDIWLDKNTGLIVKVKYSRMGEWEYRLKSFE